jgi:hypothetical protein
MSTILLPVNIGSESFFLNTNSKHDGSSIALSLNEDDFVIDRGG